MRKHHSLTRALGIDKGIVSRLDVQRSEIPEPIEFVIKIGSAKAVAELEIYCILREASRHKQSSSFGTMVPRHQLVYQESGTHSLVDHLDSDRVLLGRLKSSRGYLGICSLKPAHGQNCAWQRNNKDDCFEERPMKKFIQAWFVVSIAKIQRSNLNTQKLTDNVSSAAVFESGE
jgi:hypothetical protein